MATSWLYALPESFTTVYLCIPSTGDPGTISSFIKEKLPITPNYLANPAFPYVSQNQVAGVHHSAPSQVRENHVSHVNSHDFNPASLEMQNGKISRSATGRDV